MSNSSYVSQLESLLTELVEMFEYDPDCGVYTYEDEDGNLAVLSDEQGDVINRANDLLYEVEPDGAGYATEENEG